MTDDPSGNETTQASKRISPYEVAALGLFTFAFVLLTATFTSLGMYYYNQASAVS